MRQSELGEYECSGEQCPKGCGTFENVRVHWGRMHEGHFPDGVDRIECPQGCGEYKDLGMHWTQAHDVPFPENVPKITKASRERYASGARGREVSEKTRKKISRANRGNTHTTEARRAISEATEGENNPFYGQTHSAEARQKMSAEKRGTNHWIYGTTRPAEVREKISDGLSGENAPWFGETFSEEHVQNIIDSASSGKVCSTPTKHEVRNKWELEIDLMLHDAGYVAEYEPGPFDLDGRLYTPDFQVDGDVIEIKGHVWDDEDERAEMFMESYPEHRYIVVGTKLPADVWMSWEDRDQLCGLLDT